MMLVASIVLLQSCLPTPLESVGEPDEFAYNLWLLSALYIYPEELQGLDSLHSQPHVADTVQLHHVTNLYASLSDLHTRYVAPVKATSTKNEVTSSWVPGDLGIELQWAEGDSILVAGRVYPGSPAQLAGVNRYDTLVAIDETELRGADAATTYWNLLGQKATLRLGIARAGQGRFAIDLTKGPVQVPTVFLDTISGIEVITIRRFVETSLDSGGSHHELRNLLKTTNSAKTRIFDLRGNLGGQLSQCVEMADEFLDTGVVLRMLEHSFGTRGEPLIDTITIGAKPGGAGLSGDVLILVDRLTASCSEIFAFALQERRGALLVGERTYGKGIGQGYWDTPLGGLAIITSMQIRTPNGLDYHGVGLTPDIASDSYNALATALNHVDSGAATLADRALRKYSLQSEPSGENLCGACTLQPLLHH